MFFDVDQYNRSLTVHLLFLRASFAHAKHLRGRAEEFRRVAQNIREKHTRSIFLELARCYDALEEEALAMVD
jgi:hypothetical protein